MNPIIRVSSWAFTANDASSCHFRRIQKNVTGPSVSHHATWVQEVKRLKPHNSSFAHTGRDGGVTVKSSRLILKGFLQWLAPSLHSKKVHGLFWMGVVCYLHVRALRLRPAVRGALQRAGGVPESSWVQFQDPYNPDEGSWQQVMDEFN